MATSNYLNDPEINLNLSLPGCDDCFKIGDTNFGDMKEDLSSLLEFTYNAIDAALADIEAETSHVQAEKERILEERRLAAERDGGETVSAGGGPGVNNQYSALR